MTSFDRKAVYPSSAQTGGEETSFLGGDQGNGCYDRKKMIQSCYSILKPGKNFIKKKSLGRIEGEFL